MGAFTGAMFGAIGDQFGHGLESQVSTGKVLAHGFAGGISSVLNGGKFGHGFASAGMTAGLGDAIFTKGAEGWERVKNAVKAAIVGGTMSRLTGGKFQNGAVTGAFSRLLNDDLFSPSKKLISERVVEYKNDDGTTSIKRILSYGVEDSEVVASLKLRDGVTLGTDNLRDQLLDLSEYLDGTKIDVISGYRSQAEQDAIRLNNPDAAIRSAHTYNEAADIKIPGYSRIDVWKASYDVNRFNRVNLYNNTQRGIHVDNRGNERLFFLQWVRVNRDDYK